MLDTEVFKLSTQRQAGNPSNRERGEGCTQLTIVIVAILSIGLGLEFKKLFDYLSGIKNSMDDIERKLDEITTTLKEIEINTIAHQEGSNTIMP